MFALTYQTDFYIWQFYVSKIGPNDKGVMFFNLLCFIIGLKNAEVDQIHREDEDVPEQDNIGVPNPDIIVVPDQDNIVVPNLDIIVVPDQDNSVVPYQANVVLPNYCEQENLDKQEKSEDKKLQSKRFGQIQNVQERLL